MQEIQNLFDSNGISREIKNSDKQQVLDFIDGVNTDIQGDIQICTIVDYYCEGQDEGKQICDKLISVINNQEIKFSGARFDYEFIENESKARFTLFGTPDYIIKTLEPLK
ncbi:MAG: hypothetical protein GX254_01110 [Clostridiales bacterium]|jgi:hypothetical protein|nr:hypothetical protein [Clostridiales bacterium]